VDALVRQHAGLAASEASRVYLPGADRDDVLQEARIGLWRAAEDLEPLAGVPFAALVIRRRLTSALRAATRPKHLILTHSVREGHVGERGRRARPIDRLETGPSQDPAHIAQVRCELSEVVRALERLSRLERRSSTWWRVGAPTPRSAEATGLGDKAVDKTLQRAERKLRAAASALIPARGVWAVRAMPSEQRAHCEGVYATKAPSEVSWFEPVPETSLTMIEGLALPPAAPILDVGGGASRLGQELVARGHTDVTVVDISTAALERARAGARGRSDRAGRGGRARSPSRAAVRPLARSGRSLISWSRMRTAAATGPVSLEASRRRAR